jgi:hypothetical protein
MSGTPPNSDFVMARFFAALFALGAIIILGSIAWDVWTGISYAKVGGAISRASDPQGFWVNSAFHGAGALLLGWASHRMHRSAGSASNP